MNSHIPPKHADPVTAAPTAIIYQTNIQVIGYAKDVRVNIGTSTPTEPKGAWSRIREAIAWICRIWRG